MLKSHLKIQYGAEEEEPVEEEGDEEEPKPEEEDVKIINIPDKKLFKSEVALRLSWLGKTANGDGYTYLKATLTNMSLTKIDIIKCFKHLQFVDLSMNKLTINELQVVTELPYLVLLQADKNELQSANLNKMKYFQVLIMNNNYITSVNDIFQPELSTLELGFNKITELSFANKMPTMKVLDFRNNMIQHIVGLDFPMLDSLYLAYNKITSLVGLETLLNLRILHLRRNPIRLLDGFHENHTKLIYINLRGCGVRTLKQIRRLKVLTGIETLILTGCPYMGGTGEEEDGAEGEEDPELRLEVLATLPRLKRLNKVIVTPEERIDAKALMQQWIEDGEKELEELEDEGAEEDQFNEENED